MSGYDGTETWFLQTFNSTRRPPDLRLPTGPARGLQFGFFERKSYDVDDLLCVRQDIEPGGEIFQPDHSGWFEKLAHVRVEFPLDIFSIDRVLRTATTVKDFSCECPTVRRQNGDPSRMTQRRPSAFDLGINRN